MIANVDFVGVVYLLRCLVRRGGIGQIEAEKIARRVARQLGATIDIMP